ncbi:hypothetical protein C8R44DRAFT_822442 [Mycena epipterygia]|nr:hypothetical protein C8R44DRAFT_822442 [Mycena epipterygia]
MSANVGNVAAKLDAVSGKLDKAMAFIARQTPLEMSVAKQLQDNGGLQNVQFVNELAKKMFGLQEVSPQAQASLKQGLNEALRANMPGFTLKVEAAQKEMSEALERSTETILHQLNSGPYQLIKDEDIRAVWKSMNWRISCKARHFVDAVHNYFAQKFGEHRHKAGEVHPEQWTLNILSQVTYYPNISDAIDDDGSGYISVHEVNHFFKSRPKEWSAVHWLAFWAAGWKQNALAYKTRCKELFFDLEAAARMVLPENHRCVKSYINTSGLSELWLVVNSLTSEGLGHRGMHQAPETEPLNALRAEIMLKETAHIQSRLEKIKYQLESPETVMAVLGTHRLEGFILCFLELILDRHRQIIEAANTLVLGEGEFETMTFSLQNLVAAFGTRYHTLTESWKQQRLDTGFLVQCFAGGIFHDWHEVFQDRPTAYNEVVETPKTSGSYLPEIRGRAKLSPRLEDILAFPLPPQPSLTSSASEDPGHGRQRRKPAPLPLQGPRHNGHNTSAEYFYRFDFERPPSDRVAGADSPANIFDVYRKAKKRKLNDRITSLESELSEIKSMLSQLIVISTPRRSDY